jgi:predicted DsbA family dithiol-disulfide isomerase
MEGIEFARRTPESLLANTHRALAASAIVQAQDPALFDGFHHDLFHASFGELRNIGDPAVLREIAGGVGLDVAALDAALAAGAGEAALREAAEDARKRCITAVPAFVVGGAELIVGAQPAETLRQAVERAAARAAEKG